MIQESRQHNSPSPQSNTSSNKTRRSRASAGTPQPESQDEKRPARPPSPKSRNASRSRIRGRSDSTASQHENLATATQNQDQTPSRPASRAKARDQARSALSVPDRLSSSQSRVRSRSRRGEEKAPHREQQTIPIVASPSLLSANFYRDISTPVAMDYYLRPFSRAGQQPPPPMPMPMPQNVTNNEASVVATRNDRVANRDGQSWSMASSVGHGTPLNGSRPASRGRTAQVIRDRDAERASSADSTRNGRLHTRIGRRQSQDTGVSGGRHSSRKGSESGRRPSRSGKNNDEFERVEVINCPECPVHGRHSASGGESSRASPATNPGSTSSPKSRPMHRPEVSSGEGSASRGSSASGTTKRSHTTNGSTLSGRTDQMNYRQNTTTGGESNIDAAIPRSVPRDEAETELRRNEDSESLGRRCAGKENIESVERTPTTSTAA
ncbi:hypothetical protein PT974_01326 [Cladobotryum mycophilum]|uniref:Uncharacterized protein n=1 Tax=Cladobotryum mycophilum TaxID=491253 RepID=A0ABR0T4A9_9HYPO